VAGNVIRIPADEPPRAGARPSPAGAGAALVVIPARNEEAAVAGVVASAVSRGFAVAVVDDGSTDRTAERAAAAGATVLRLAFHAGSWPAIQTGMRLARRRGYECVVTIDADGQHNAADIERLVEALATDERPSVVIGACVERANRRRRLAWQVLRRLGGLTIDDLTSGFRAYDRRAIDLLADSDQTLLEYQDVGVLMALARNDSEIREVAVDMNPRRHGRSRVFSSWPMVGSYLLCSALIGASRRPIAIRRPGRDRAES